MKTPSLLEVKTTALRSREYSPHASPSWLIAGGLVGEALHKRQASNHPATVKRLSHFWARVKSGSGREAASLIVSRGQATGVLQSASLLETTSGGASLTVPVGRYLSFSMVHATPLNKLVLNDPDANPSMTIGLHFIPNHNSLDCGSNAIHWSIQKPDHQAYR